MDLERIVAFEKQSFSDPFDKATFSQILAAEPEGFLVAESGHQLLGYIAAASRGDEGWVYSFAVEPGSRRRGIGRLLMKAALNYLSTKTTRVYLQVSVNNPAAMSLYEKFSFVKTRRIKRYYPNGDDAFLMLLELTRR